MDNKKEQINELRDRIKTLEHNNLEAMRELGKEIYDRNKKAAGEKYSAFLKEISALYDKRKSEEAQLNDLGKMTEQIRELSDKDKKLESSIKNLEKENAKHYANIGINAFRAYQSSILTGKRYEEIFGGLLELNTKINILEDKIESSRDKIKEGGFFTKIGTGFSRMVSKTRRNISETNMNKQSQKAGRELCESGLLEDISVKEVALAARPYLQNKASIDSMSAECSDLRKEISDIQMELDAVCGDLKYSAKLNEIKGNIQTLDNEADNQAETLARAVIKNKAADLALSENSKQLLEQIPERDKKIEKYSAEIEKLEIELQIERLEDEKNKVAFSMDVQNQKAQEAKDSAKTHKAEMQSLEKQIESLKSKIE